MQKCTNSHWFRILLFAFIVRLSDCESWFGIDWLNGRNYITFIQEQYKPCDWLLYKTSIKWIVCHEHSLLYTCDAREKYQLYGNVNKEKSATTNPTINTTTQTCVRYGWHRYEQCIASKYSYAFESVGMNALQMIQLYRNEKLNFWTVFKQAVSNFRLWRLSNKW